MTKAELIAEVNSKLGVPKSQVENVLSEITVSISNALKAGQIVDIPGFGKFSVKDRAARKGRNPQTGAEIQIAATRKAAFKPSSRLLG